VRFLLSRRWALFAVTVVVLAYGCWWLGRWQFHRLHDREALNSQIRTNLALPPTPVDRLLARGRPSPARDEWRRVSATGTYEPDQSIVIRYQTRDGGAGVDVVTPLRTSSGTWLIVDRGWLSTSNVGMDRVDAPAPPAGRVRVVGFVRADATGGAAAVADRSARAVSSAEIGKALGIPVYGGFVDLQRQTPPPRTSLVPAEAPDLGNGPHFFYGLQWWFFGLLAVFGFGYLAYDERRKLHGPPGPGPRRPGSDGPASPPSDGPQEAAVDRQHHAGDEARSR